MAHIMVKLRLQPSPLLGGKIGHNVAQSLYGMVCAHFKTIGVGRAPLMTYLFA